MLKVIQILFLSSLLLGAFSGEAFAQGEQAQAEPQTLNDLPIIQEILNRQNKIMNDKNFPMNDSETVAIFKKADRVATSMRSFSDINAVWNTQEGSMPNFDYFSEVLNLPKVIGSLSLSKVKSKAQLPIYRKHLEAIITHEYGHAILHKNLMLDSKPFAKVVGKLQELKSLNMNNVPSTIYMNIQVILAYHEFFGDALAFAVTEDADATFKALKYVVGTSFGDVSSRKFEMTETPKMKKIVKEVVLDAGERSRFDYYQALLLQRPLIARYMAANPGGSEKMINFLYETIREESDKWLLLPSDKLSLGAVIDSFNKNLKNKLDL